MASGEWGENSEWLVANSAPGDAWRAGELLLPLASPAFPFTTRYLLLATRYSLLATRYSPPPLAIHLPTGLGQVGPGRYTFSPPWQRRPILPFSHRCRTRTVGVQQRHMANMLASAKLGLALSGGGPRGLAHIGVIKALESYGLQPHFIVGTSAGSIVGAMLAAGMKWREMRAIAASIFWPELFDGHNLERFCKQHLPATFAELQYPFAAIASEWPSRQLVVLQEGNLPSAISASCALPGVRRPVLRDGLSLLDGGIACPLPTLPTRAMGATWVIASDVLGISSLLRAVGVEPMAVTVRRFFPSHYRQALEAADILISPSIPLVGLLPTDSGLDAIIAAGEAATHAVLARWFHAQLQQTA